MLRYQTRGLVKAKNVNVYNSPKKNYSIDQKLSP